MTAMQDALIWTECTYTLDGQDFSAVRVTWDSLDKAGFIGDGSDSKEIVESLLESGAPHWVSEASGELDVDGWYLIGELIGELADEPELEEHSEQHSEELAALEAPAEWQYEFASLARTWSGLSSGLLLVEWAYSLAGPKPVEPDDDASDCEVDAWNEAVGRWEKAGDSALAAAGALPVSIAHARHEVEFSMIRVLRREFEVEDQPDDWTGELKENIVTTLGTDMEEVNRLWGAWR